MIESSIIKFSLEVLVSGPDFKRHNVRLFLVDGDFKLNISLPDKIGGVPVEILSGKEVEEIVKRNGFIRFFTLNEPKYSDDSVIVTINHTIQTESDRFLKYTNQYRYLNEIELKSLKKLSTRRESILMTVQYTRIYLGFDSKTQSYEVKQSELLSFPVTEAPNL